MKKIVASMLLVLPLMAGAQKTPSTENPKVTVVSRGHDVRQVLSDIFVQAKKSCVIQKSIQANLFLSLEDTSFDQALQIICKQAGLTAEVTDGVYFIRQAVPKPVITTPTPVVTPVHPAVKAPEPAPVVLPHKLPTTVLAKRLTTRFHKVMLKTVLEEFSIQTGVNIEIDPQVPSYRMDAFLINTSLKYALDEVTRAANLSYKFTDHQSILVTPAESKVTIIQ